MLSPSAIQIPIAYSRNNGHSPQSKFTIAESEPLASVNIGSAEQKKEYGKNYVQKITDHN
jgi:hypothetical protein